MPASVVENTFASVNKLTLPKSDRDYISVNAYIEATKAFANLSSQSIYIFDYYKNDFLYLTNNPLFLCGHDVKQVKKEGFRFFIDNVPKAEVALLCKIHIAGFDFFNALSAGEKLEHTISYNFHLQHKSNAILINHKMTPLKLDEAGSIWLAIGFVSIAVGNDLGDVEIQKNDSHIRYVYNFKKERWEEEPNVQISNREKEIIIFSAQGLSNKEISQKLYLAETTVKFHKSNIFKKLKVSNMVEAIAYIGNHYKL